MKKGSVRQLKMTGRSDRHRLEKFVEEICEYYNISDEHFGNILLATTESAEVLFAMGDDEGLQQLQVTFEKNPKGLLFKIKLEGIAVTVGTGEDVLEREVRRHKLGRDLYIIRSLADEIEISLNARGIKLVFYVTSINYEKSLERIRLLKSFWEKTHNVVQTKNGN